LEKQFEGFNFFNYLEAESAFRGRRGVEIAAWCDFFLGGRVIFEDY
jgi:hypothetical protein